tara:strand:- start:1869 stop:2426 length:558 start_codon:yes stop_codon:yes gene_type:complete
MQVLQPAIFFDRDGVLNRTFVRNGKPYAPRHLADFEIVPEAEGVASTLKREGFQLIVVTNQPDVGNGLVPQETVEAMNRQMLQTLPIDHVEVCFHSQTAGCNCRKPAPGMLLKAARKFGIGLGASFLIGDRHSDIEAGQRAGCRTVLIERGYREPVTTEPDFTTRSLQGASEWILSHHSDPAHRR